ncbi:virulence protein [Metabacillus sp. B2-18]|uniref:virulence protein n=1 Tax=Metabacillus sp. B2-18 TaxID=2897333 RepID=UPI001E2F0DCB|nr:virulence protein [Metabacillus sp. B2-18]UGB30686.1 virulence protein [Metabacillus sp. B2-18]
MEFKITYEVKGQRRKELVQAISEFLNTIPKYKGVPTCAYEIGGLVVDREGAVILNDSMTPAEVDRMVAVLEGQGFQPTNYGESAFDGIEVAMPREMFTDKAIENLHKIVNAKGELISKAVGTMDLRIIENDVKVKFPWFPRTEDSEEVAHYTQFTDALCKMAIERNRVASTPRKSENEKYDFRCFLLRLGFIGDEYKALRKFLLRNLTGNAAFKHGRPKKDEN